MLEQESHAERLAPPGPPGVPWAHVVAAAMLLTALNAIKPVHIDDPVFLAYGVEFVAHPLDPYDFRFGSPALAPANELLTPPVVPYWLGTGTLLLGDNPVLLKLWLLPFALTLSWGIAFLLTRTAPSLRVPLLWLGLISPTILPSFNFMLDVPSLALGVTALAIAMRSIERESWTLALFAGMLAGLAAQTKYTGTVSIAAIFVWCVLRGRPVRGVLVVAVSAALAVGWEYFVACTQGESHFLVQFRQRQGKPIQRVMYLILPLFSQAAGLGPAVGLLGLKALGWSGRSTVVAGAGVLGAFSLLAVVPSQSALIMGSNGRAALTASNLIYGLMAILVCGSFFRLCLNLLRRTRNPDAPDRVCDWFLLAWLALEICGYFALSPFPAARRLVGPLLVLTLIAGRVAHLRGVTPRTASRFAAFGVGLALLFFSIDVLEANAGKSAVREVARRNYTPAEGGTFWHLSWWSVSYYADHQGLSQLQLNRQMPRVGDLLALHDVKFILEFMAKIPEIALELIDTVEVDDRFPLQLQPGFYVGRTPMENHRDCRVRILVYRVTAVPNPPR